MKYAIFGTLALMSIFLLVAHSSAEVGADIIDKIKLTDADIPADFAYGVLPDRVKRVLKGNPAQLDRAAIRKVIKDMELYPGGDHTTVLAMHAAVIAHKKNPHDDDIVCYIIVYKDMKSAKHEIEKLSALVGANKTRTVMVTRDNCAVFLFVDEEANFHHIQKMAGTITARLKK